MPGISDVRLKGVEDLVTPASLLKTYQLSDSLLTFIAQSRISVERIIKGLDDRLLCVVGPCSIHDPVAALEYARKLKSVIDKTSDKLFIVMRAYFEKPRTSGGWKGLIMDPDMDGSYNANKGLRMARELLIQITGLGVPVGCEVLDPIVPQYIDDLMCWAAIGARTCESQVHRSLASGLSIAVGFKNGTNGEIIGALNSIKVAKEPSAFLGIDREGRSCIVRSKGNDCCHLILRGGEQSPNYYEADVKHAIHMMVENALVPSIIIDCSHGNSLHDPSRQTRVMNAVLDQVLYGQRAIRGFMLESNLKHGSQKFGHELVYGLSVTDACLGWDETEDLIMNTYEKLKDNTAR
ncbi:MAG: 3-deoxy-7-phosphoheptulonate synthase [Sphaerochaetaceae bacterium]|jgi:3-deoxy-7-phosphoheptulonate synthase|nr:3-deoxy-7-phosphoheptulonate synthase [Sphaerochaetaceae bacterium]